MARVHSACIGSQFRGLIRSNAQAHTSLNDLPPAVISNAL